MEYDNLLELVTCRRSCRKFKIDPVPEEHIGKMIEVARWAPSGANSQPWEFIVITKQEIRTRIVEIINEYRETLRGIEAVRKPELRFNATAAGYVRAPVFIILCGDPRTLVAFPVRTKQLRGQSHFASGLASAFLYLSLAAETLGLGAQWVSVIAHPEVQNPVKDYLQVPRGYEVYDMMALGYADSQPKPRLVRERADITHHSCYDSKKYRTDEELESFIASLRQARH